MIDMRYIGTTDAGMYDYSNINVNICILVGNMSWYQSQQSSLKNTEIVSDMMRLGPDEKFYKLC